MKKAIRTKVFTSGNSQAVRVPKQYQLQSSEVEIFKRGHELVIREVPENLYVALINLPKTSDDFMIEPRVDLPPQEREW